MEKNKSNSDFFNGLTPDIMQRYLEGSLSPEIKEKVERYLEENPFEAEAMDGLKSYSVDLNQELTSLNEQLSDKLFPETRKTSRYFWAAAAVITLLVVSGLIIYLMLPGQQEVSPIAVNQEISGNKEQEQEFRDEGQGDKDESQVQSTNESPLLIEPEPDRQAGATTADEIVKLDVPPGVEAEPVPAEPTDENLLEETIVEDITFKEAPAPALESAAALNARTKSKKSVADVAVAQADQSLELPSAQTPDNWNRYLTDNLQYPEAARINGIEGKVKIKFLVDTQGNPEGIEITEGLGFGCNEEAIRLIQQGPNWKPAQVNGVPVISQAEIEINFHPKKDH